MIRGCALAMLGAAMLMWTAVANGRPPVFTDTALYFNQAEYLFEALGWVSPARAVAPPSDPTALPATPGQASVSAAIDRARSPAYGAPIYLLQRLGGLWLAAGAQAVAVAGVIHLLYRAAAPRAPLWGYLALVAGLAALTPLPAFASWIMPDVFAGVMGCALLLLLVYPDRLGAAKLAGVCALNGYALAVHRSNLLDAVLVAGLTLPWLRVVGVAWREVGRRAALVGVTAVAAITAGAALEAPVQARAGQPIGSPPFLSARVLADGPGQAYLHSVCRGPATPFELCRFAGRSITTSDQVLWSVRRRTAVFLAADPAGRLRMEREDVRFALGAWLALPLAETRAAAWNALQQFGEIYADGPLEPQSFYVTDGYWRRTVLPRILPHASACLRPCPPAVGKTASEGLERLGLLLAAGALAWRLSAREVRRRVMSARRAERGQAHRQGRAQAPDDLSRLLVALAVVAGLLVVNAAVCGALSGPFPRYQARLVWLAPLMAGLLVAGGGTRRRVPADAAPPAGQLAEPTPLDAPEQPI